MKAWGKVLQALCEEAKEKGIDLYILEADEKLNFYGTPLKEFCKEELFDAEDVKVFKRVKENLSEQMEGRGYVVLISPMNLWADIYEYNKPKFKNPNDPSRPFGVSFDRFRIGFFDEKQKAVDFMLDVAKRLRDKFNLHLHVFYT
ncbi:hypothetical protein [Aquifex aeolicus]|uniref:hypothetical protein n=1 Tax=Aquifex aeolicus TaxID=63363 RepID=UPI0002FFAF25|nr:hypothetical protein [Aquifex aeolicus]